MSEDLSEKHPQQRYANRKRRGGLFVTDAEIVERLNVPEKIAYKAFRALDAEKPTRFPQTQKLWGG